jgi:hypothetical protein
VVLLALLNACVGIALAMHERPMARIIAAAGVIVALAVAAVPLLPDVLVQPNVATIEAKGGKVFESTEDEIASVQAARSRSPRSSGWRARR